ncbi:HNH endonuclease [Methylobacterium sp. V23]|uniref:HNH endonuclease n=1 Tax=Methylobacterium sp. V23 TaxID=2044878 RepID=UPI000CDB18FB|nr:HNH endonuclease [Methylobacterium sp. V23]POR42529.1 endonuclease [Methylobacterium sp. V23]
MTTASGRSVITRDFVLQVLIYDPVTGIFTWRQSRGGKLLGTRAGGLDGDGYEVIRLNKRAFKSHRLAWLYVHSDLPDSDLDHRDLNRANNAINNLRPATRAQNIANTKKRATNRSGYKGVSYHAFSGLYRATLFVRGKQICGKYHKKPEDAYAEYCAMAVASYGEFARLS